MDTRVVLLACGLDAFNATGFECTSEGTICAAAGVSTDSLVDLFGSKEQFAAELYLGCLRAYNRALLAPLTPRLSARRGVQALVRAHLGWIVEQRTHAQFLFDQARAEWLQHVRIRHALANAQFVTRLEAWRAPHVARGRLRAMAPMLFHSQITGPAQVYCNAWLSGRSREDPRKHADELADCAVRALVVTDGAGGGSAKHE